MRKALPWYGVAACVILLDQLSKWLVLSVMYPGQTIYVAPFWNWVLTFNSGAAFSFLSEQSGWQRFFLSGLGVVISIWLGQWIYKESEKFRLCSALALVVGGALGNVVDRVRLGVVVDFVQWHVAGYAWPAFNVADAAISVGAVLLIWDQYRERPDA